MARIWKFAVPAALVLAVATSALALAAEPELRTLDQTPETFASTLVAAMPKDKNYMISPFSLKMALAMAANGASGDTRQEILDALGIADLEQYNNHARAFIENSNKNKAVEFNVANSIWNNTDRFGDPGFGFSDGFKKIIADYFSGTASNINNANGAKTINDWIALQTKGRIRDVVNGAAVREAVSILVNTIYFKGDWLVPFESHSTRDDTFTDRNGRKSTTAFMNNTGHYSYFADDHIQMLAKPYKDRNIQMYFALPKRAGTEYVKPYLFSDAVNSMTNEYIRLKLPKFKTEYLHANLADIMWGMGVRAAFDERKADFLGMFSKKPPLNAYIESILQKTFIEVDETGTEAAAATAVPVGKARGLSPSPRPIDFICDRPFFYFIRNDATGEILFMGEYAFVE